MTDVDRAPLREYRQAHSRFHLFIAQLTGSPSMASAVAAVRMRLNDLLDAIPLLEANLAHSIQQPPGHRRAVGHRVGGSESGRRHARLVVLAPHQQADPHAHQLHLVRCRRRLHPRVALPVDATAYAAVTSIATIGLYIAYILPILLRLPAGNDLQRGPWHLGRWSSLVGWIGVAWVAVITVLFVPPQVSPIKAKTFNLRNRGGRVVALFSGAYWLSARSWFKGPKVQGSVEELPRSSASSSECV